MKAIVSEGLTIRSVVLCLGCVYVTLLHRVLFLALALKLDLSERDMYISSTVPSATIHAAL